MDVRMTKVAVGQALRESAGAEAVETPVIGEMLVAEGEEAGEPRGHGEVVVHPEPAHGVMHCGIDAHRHLIGVFGRDLVIHVEEIAVALANGLFALAFDGVGEIQIHAESTGPDAAAVIAGFLGGT